MTSAGLPPLPPRRRPPRPRYLLRVALFLFVLLIVGALGCAGYLYYKLNAAIDRVGVEDPAPVTKPVRANPVTVLLLGIDTRPKSHSLNTDVIMVASLNPERKSAAVVSIPRDTLVKVKGYSSTKANAYYAAFYNADKKTADAKTKALFGAYLDVPIDYVAKIGFKGFEEIVDKLGGLTIDVDMNMCYVDRYDGTSIKLTKGTHHLNGSETLDFVRYRKGNCGGAADSNDMQRNERQQQVIGKIVDKLKSPDGLLKLGSVIEAAADNVETDIPSQQIKSFIRTYAGIDRDKINYVHLEGDWESPYVIIRPDELKRAQSALQEQIR